MKFIAIRFKAKFASVSFSHLNKCFDFNTFSLILLVLPFFFFRLCMCADIKPKLLRQMSKCNEFNEHIELSPKTYIHFIYTANIRNVFVMYFQKIDIHVSDCKHLCLSFFPLRRLLLLLLSRLISVRQVAKTRLFYYASFCVCVFVTYTRLLTDWNWIYCKAHRKASKCRVKSIRKQTANISMQH